MQKIRAVIFDRDATLNATTQILRPWQSADETKTDGYVLAPGELSLFPSVKPALTLLRAQGILPFVFTQQNCVGKGLLSAQGLADIHARMNELLGQGAAIEKFYTAWNTAGQPEDPRAKPSPAMIHEILADYGLSAAEVIVVGDSKRDYKSAKAASVDFVWVRDDLGRVSEEEMQATGCPVFDDVLAFVQAQFPSPHAGKALNPHISR